MKVKASLGSNKYGFVNGERVYDGEVFEVSEKDFTDSWMIKIRKKPGPKPNKPDGVKDGD